MKSGAGIAPALHAESAENSARLGARDNTRLAIDLTRTVRAAPLGSLDWRAPFHSIHSRVRWLDIATFNAAGLPYFLDPSKRKQRFLSTGVKRDGEGKRRGGQKGWKGRENVTLYVLRHGGGAGTVT